MGRKRFCGDRREEGADKSRTRDSWGSVVAVPDSVFANVCIVIWKDLRDVIFQEQEKRPQSVIESRVSGNSVVILKAYSEM